MIITDTGNNRTQVSMSKFEALSLLAHLAKALARIEEHKMDAEYVTMPASLKNSDPGGHDFPGVFEVEICKETA